MNGLFRMWGIGFPLFLPTWDRWVTPKPTLHRPFFRGRQTATSTGIPFVPKKIFSSIIWPKKRRNNRPADWTRGSLVQKSSSADVQLCLGCRIWPEEGRNFLPFSLAGQSLGFLLSFLPPSLMTWLHPSPKDLSPLLFPQPVWRPTLLAFFPQERKGSQPTNPPFYPTWDSAQVFRGGKERGGEEPRAIIPDGWGGNFFMFRKAAERDGGGKNI